MPRLALLTTSAPTPAAAASPRRPPRPRRGAPRRQPRLVPPPQADELGKQHEEGERDAKARQDDVEPERGRHLPARRDDLRAHLRDGVQHLSASAHGPSRPWRSRSSPGPLYGQAPPRKYLSYPSVGRLISPQQSSC